MSRPKSRPRTNLRFFLSNLALIFFFAITATIWGEFGDKQFGAVFFFNVAKVEALLMYIGTHVMALVASVMAFGLYTSSKIHKRLLVHYSLGVLAGVLLSAVQMLAIFTTAEMSMAIVAGNLTKFWLLFGFWLLPKALSMLAPQRF